MIQQVASTTRPQLYRLSYIDKMIKTGRYPNSRSLSEDLGVSPRTVLRDVEFMKDSLSAPLEYSAQKRGFYYTETEYSMGLLKLTEGELLALFLGHNLLNKCKGTPFEQHVLSAFNKICCYLQESVSINFGQLSESVTFDLEPLRGEEKQVAAHFSAIIHAINRRKTVKLLHYAIAKDTCRERLVDPYQVRYHQGVWYLIGFCHLRQAIRFFALDRIRELQPTELTFAVTEEFNPDEFFHDTFQLYKGADIHQIKIWFSPTQARWIREKQWHPTQVIEENPDGSLVLIMHTSGLIQVKRWVLSFGDDAKVLAPPELVSAVVKELNSARNVYLET